MSAPERGLEPDPVIEAYKKDIDRTLLRESLRLTSQQRLERLMRLQEFAEELNHAGRELGSKPMWQRFTEEAKQAVFCAREEARRRGADLVAPEDLLLGLLRRSRCRGVAILRSLGAEGAQVRAELECRLLPESAPADRKLTLDPRACQVLNLVYDEARIMDDYQIGTEHLLLGILREGGGPANEVLSSLGVDLDGVRREVPGAQQYHSETRNGA